MNKVPAGWNDPPPVPVNYQPPAQGSKSRLLNKRVPFNFSNTDTNSQLPATEITNINQLPELPGTKLSDNVTSTVNVHKDEDKISIINVIEKLHKLTDNVEDTNKKLDIIKRLDIMKKMWEDNELSAQVTLLISNFADALDTNNIKLAHDIYSSLTLNSASVCSSWIIAFKYILHQLKE